MKTQELINTYINKKYQPSISGNMILYSIPASDLTEVFTKLYREDGWKLKTLKAVDDRTVDGSFKIYYIFGRPQEEYFLAPFIELKNTTDYPSLVASIHEVNWYEQEIYSMFGLRASGHLNLQGLLLHENWPSDIYPLRKDFPWNKRPDTATSPRYQFQEIKGEGIYEIPVGPVHAGIIEPGHFRFSAAGEEIVNLEPLLGYVHKGSEKLFEVLPLEQKVRLAERISGDTSFTHALAFCMGIEKLGSVEVPERAEYLRVVYSELERMATHFIDVGMVINDTAFSFGANIGGRLRERIVRWNARLTGHRFLRGACIIGGVSKDISSEDATELAADLEAIRKDFNEIIDICHDNEALMSRLHNTGLLAHDIALDYGVVGMAGRASGIDHDVRRDNPYAAYPQLNLKIAAHTDGDVFARYTIRAEEINNSIDLIQEALEKLPAGKIHTNPKITLKENTSVISLAEGWRGEIVYLIMTDAKGAVTRVGVRDPSFLNWPAVPHAVVGNIVPDFPLVNKSFDLSYSGTDR